MSEDTLIYTEGGFKKIADLSPRDQKDNSWCDKTITVIGESEKKVATRIWKGEVEESIKITTSLGYTIEGSHRHPLRVCSIDGEHSWKTLPNIIEGDTLVMKTNSQCHGDYISTVPFVESYELSSHQRELEIPPLIEEKICHLFGVLIGDGCLTQTDTVEVSKGDLDVLEGVKKITSELFAANPRTYEDNRSNCSRVGIYSKQFRDFLLWCGLGFEKSTWKSIPWTVLQNTLSCQIAFIKGLFDTDGGVNSNIHYTTTSEQLAIGVHVLLLNMGIVSNKSVLHEASEGMSKAYRITISGHYARRFYDEVGFSCQRKQAKLVEKFSFVPYGGWIKCQVGAVPDGAKLLGALREDFPEALKKRNREGDNKDKRLYGFISEVARGRTTLRCANLPVLVERIPNIAASDSGRRIKEIYDNGIFYDTVKKIETRRCMMYDLYVPNGHDFVANGFVNHNSQGLTLEAVEMDLSKVFEAGQGYVALSRARNLNSMRILKMKDGFIRVNDRVLKFYENLKVDKPTAEEVKKDYGPLLKIIKRDGPSQTVVKKSTPLKRAATLSFVAKTPPNKLLKLEQ